MRKHTFSTKHKSSGVSHKVSLKVPTTLAEAKTAIADGRLFVDERTLLSDAIRSWTIKVQDHLREQDPEGWEAFAKAYVSGSKVTHQVIVPDQNFSAKQREALEAAGVTIS